MRGCVSTIKKTLDFRRMRDTNAPIGLGEVPDLKWKFVQIKTGSRRTDGVVQSHKMQALSFSISLARRPPVPMQKDGAEKQKLGRFENKK